MESSDDYFANQRTHTQMLEEAAKIHPDMKVRLVCENQWEMYMPTEYTESFELPEEYKGTQAWVMWENRDGGYGNELERYRYKQGYSGSSLEAVAKYINLSHEFTVRVNELLEASLAEAGLQSPQEIDYDTMNDRVISSYWKKYEPLYKAAQEKANEEFAEREEALKEAYDL